MRLYMNRFHRLPFRTLKHIVPSKYRHSWSTLRPQPTRRISSLSLGYSASASASPRHVKVPDVGCCGNSAVIPVSPFRGRSVSSWKLQLWLFGMATETLNSTYLYYESGRTNLMPIPCYKLTLIDFYPIATWRGETHCGLLLCASWDLRVAYV